VAGRVIRVDISNPDAETVSAVSAVLQSGGTVVYPSDTVYGVLADASSLAAVKKVAEIKGYTELRPFIILVESVKKALKFTSDKSLESAMRQHWSGTVTLVVPGARSVPEWLISREGTVAVRLPSDRFSRILLRQTGLDLVSTSANTKGDPFALSVESVPQEILYSVSMVLDGGTLSGRRPSRVVDLTGECPVDVRR
jgi:L-threonylcarbamoyladenylate synthase